MKHSSCLKSSRQKSNKRNRQVHVSTVHYGLTHRYGSFVVSVEFDRGGAYADKSFNFAFLRSKFPTEMNDPGDFDENAAKQEVQDFVVLCRNYGNCTIF